MVGKSDGFLVKVSSHHGLTFSSILFNIVFKVITKMSEWNLPSVYYMLMTSSWWPNGVRKMKVCFGKQRN